MKIITERPKGMSYEKYRKERKANQKQIKRRVKHGKLVYLASQIFKQDETQMERTYPPAIKSYDRRGRVVYKPMKKKKLV